MPAQDSRPLGASDHSGFVSAVSRPASKRLCDFMQENVKSIVGEWEVFAKTLTPSSTGMTPLALRDHINQILAFIVTDIKSSQTEKEQTRKSRGKKEKGSDHSAAETHASLRLAGGFDIEQMVSEYRALRASVIKLWSRASPLMDAEDLEDLTRFNESIDQALSESVSFYMKEIIRSKDLFVGILSHDLRSPVQAVMLSAELIPRMGPLTARQAMLAQGTSECANRINSLIDNLLDVTRARFGAGLPIIRSSMDMAFTGNQVIDEVRIVHPDRTILVNTSGNLKGDWDKARIGQIFSNLLGNALQYGFKISPINVVITGDADAVTLEFHNTGESIPSEKINTIFNPLTRAATGNDSRSGSANLGLGLFITQEIVVAHGGTIRVTSSDQKGTTFTARLPRSKSAPTLHVA